ncbi:hypothetical protein GCM10027075_33430 [Streptomyces heilongjiangensis]
MAPTAATDPVSSFICTGSATKVRKLPKLVIRQATQSRRKSTETRQGARSGNNETSREATVEGEGGGAAAAGEASGGDEGAGAGGEAYSSPSGLLTPPHAQPRHRPGQPVFPAVHENEPGESGG